MTTPQHKDTTLEDWVRRALESENPVVWYRCLQMIDDYLKKGNHGE